MCSSDLLGSPALTTRGLSEEDFDMVAEFLHRGSDLAVRVKIGRASCRERV